MGNWFDGAPWTGRLESAFLLLLFPFLLYLQKTFLSRTAVVWFCWILLLLKFFLTWFAPLYGLGVKVYADWKSFEDRRWERTYHTLWVRGYSDVLKRGYQTKRDFPIEWMNRDSSLQSNENGVGVEVSGYVVLPPGTKLLLITQGARSGAWITSNKEGQEKGKLPLLRSLKEAAAVDFPVIPGGRFVLSGTLWFASGDWSLFPVLLEEGGRISTKVPLDTFRLEKFDVEHSILRSALLKGAARLGDGGILLLFAAWFFHFARFYLYRGGPYPFLFFLGLSGCLFPGLFRWLFHPIIRDPTGRIFLAMSTFGLGALVILQALRKGHSWNREEMSLTHLLLIVVGPGILTFFFLQWWPDIGRVSLFSLSDDWRTYQNFAREIFVGGDFWHRGEPIFFYQPLYRYVVGLLHVFFGQAMVAQNFLDVWAVLVTSGILLSLSLSLTGSLPAAFFAPWLYLTLELGGAFRHHIGRGLQEHTAMLFIMLTVWIMFSKKECTWKRAVGGGLLAASGFYLRMDHLGVLAAAGIVRVLHPLGGLGAAWKGWKEAFLRQRKKIFLFWILLLSAFISVPLRNWIMGGAWVFTHPQNLNALWCYSWSCTLENFYKLLLTYEPNMSSPALLAALPTALVLFFGTFFGIVALIYRRGPLSFFPLGLGILLLGLIVPYFWVRVVAYPPRFSIHLLPLAVLSVTLVVHHTFGQVASRLKMESSAEGCLCAG